MSDRSATVVCDDDSPPQLKSGKVNPCFEIRAAAISAVSFSPNKSYKSFANIPTAAL